MLIAYATPVTQPTRSSRYSVAAVVVSTTSILWFFSPVLFFTAAKQDRVGTLGGLVGILLAVAGWRQPYTKHTLARVGFWLGVVGCLANFLLPTA